LLTLGGGIQNSSDSYISNFSEQSC